MTETQELLGRILTSRINNEKDKNSKERDFTEITNAINIFLAGGSITTVQYAQLTKIIIIITNTDVISTN